MSNKSAFNEKSKHRFFLLYNQVYLDFKSFKALLFAFAVESLIKTYASLVRLSI